MNNLDVVLVIDDDTDVLLGVKRMLECEGFMVYAAHEPQEGISLYEEHSDEIKLVLLDYFMDGMNGDEVFECLRRINPEVRVILATGSGDAVAKRMLADGLRAFLSKPFSPEELLDLMRDEIGADLQCHAESLAA